MGKGVFVVFQCVIDDFIESGTLHLLRMTPKVWLKQDYLTRFENVPTVFGPVTVRFQLSDQGKTLNLDYRADFHHPPKRILVHVPPLPEIDQLSIDGRKTKVSAGDVITIPSLSKQ